MPRYEWTGSRSFDDNANDRTIDPGDVVELDESIAGGHREFVHVEETSEDSDDSEDPDDESVSAPFDPSESTVDELEEKMANEEYSDAEHAALVEAEENGKNRDSAVEVLES